jgi:enoyl-CoA hydratase/carnithine racemase
MGEIRLEDRDGVLLATISNPPHGLMDSEIVEALEGLVARVAAEDGPTGVVLTGAHPERFVAHYDVEELLAAAEASPAVGRRAARASLQTVAALRRLPGGAEALDRSPAAGLSAVERFGEVLLGLGRCGAVVVAALNGSAMGGGCELALACDLRVMSRGDHLIGQPEILFGFPPGGGGTQRLARLLGSGRALRLCLDGGPVTPEQALELGLVDELADRDEVVSRAVAICARLGRRPKAAIAAVKRSVNEGATLPLTAGLRAERAEFLATLGTDAAKRAMAAYVEATASTGELAGYDRERLARALEDGRFA